MTPEDIFALTGLPFGGEILVPNARRRITPAGLRAALGWLPSRIISDGIPHSIMVHHIEDECERVRGGHEMTRQEVRQLSRCYLLLIFHDFFCARGGDNMRVWWLSYLRFFDRLYTHAWGGYVLAVLYESMDLICRHMELNHRGFTTLWEVISMLEFILFNIKLLLYLYVICIAFVVADVVHNSYTRGITDDPVAICLC